MEETYTFSVKNKNFSFQLSNEFGINVIINAKTEDNKTIKLSNFLSLLNKTEDLNPSHLACFCYVAISKKNSNTLMASTDFRTVANYYNNSPFKEMIFFGIGVGINIVSSSKNNGVLGGISRANIKFIEHGESE